MGTFDGKTVVVTGGSGGIGEKVGEVFLKEGADVFLIARNAKKLTETKEKLKELGHIDIIQADVSKVNDCKRIVEYVIEKNDHLDVLINSAGIYEEQCIYEVTEEMWDRSFNTNVKGMYFLSKYSLPYLEKVKGCIINISSTAGIIGFDENSLYCATKGAVNMFTKAFARECAPKDVRVNAICPDMVKTDMLDIGFKHSGMESREEYNKMRLSIYPQRLENAEFVLPEEVAEAAKFLAMSDSVRSITGVTLIMDNGICAAR